MTIDAPRRILCWLFLLALSFGSIPEAWAECAATGSFPISISPTSGPAAGGTIITIPGSWGPPCGATTVKFGDTAATIITFSPLTAISPPGTGTVHVSLTNVAGTSSRPEATDQFTYIEPPQVTSVTPGNGLPSGGTSVTITGTHLTGATAVTFGGLAATAFTVINDITITATTPAHAAGAADVAVTTPSGTGTGTGLFTYAPTLSAVTLAASATSVLIGQPVMLTATVSPTSAPGSITFLDGATPLCSAVVLVSGSATCQTSFSAAGAHSTKASYTSNSTDFAPAFSGSVTIGVTDQTAKTTQVIGQFLSQRNNQILTNEPDARRQVERLRGAGEGGGASGGSGFATLNAAPFGRTEGLTHELTRGAPLMGGLVGPSGLSVSDTDGDALPPLGGARAGSFLFNQDGHNATKRLSFATSLSQIMRYAAASEEQKQAGAALGMSSGADASFRPQFNPFDLWIEGKYAGFSHGSSSDLDGHFGLVSIGADYVLNRNLIVGTMVQVDTMRQHSDKDQSEIKGTGYLIGPYATIRLSDELFLQGRAEWGRSSNDVSPFLTYTDSFDSERWLLSSTLAGSWAYRGWTFDPSASVAYMEDRSESYEDTSGVRIPGVKSKLGQAKIGPKVGYRSEYSDGTTIEPYAGAQLIWNFAGDTTIDGTGVLNGELVGPTGARGRVEAGFRAMAAPGIGLDISGSYDGIGADGYEAWTGRAQVQIPLN